MLSLTGFFFFFFIKTVQIIPSSIIINECNFTLDCGTEYKLENGKVDFAKRNTKYKAQVPVSCNTGYKIKGDAQITCGSSGKWSVHTLCAIKSK